MSFEDFVDQAICLQLVDSFCLSELFPGVSLGGLGRWRRIHLPTALRTLGRRSPDPGHGVGFEKGWSLEDSRSSPPGDLGADLDPPAYDFERPPMTNTQ
jgi:hypothetical protein